MDSLRSDGLFSHKKLKFTFNFPLGLKVFLKWIELKSLGELIQVSHLIIQEREWLK